MTILYGGNWMRRVANGAAIVLASCVLASCASLVGPRQIEIPLSKLQAGVDHRFPVDNRVLELFDIRLSRPRLSLQAGTDRVALDMEAYVAPPFTKQSWTGSLALSGRLTVDAARGAVFMTEPRVERFAIDGVDEGRQRQFARFANVLMNKAVGEVPVYSFRMEDLRYAGVQFVPTRITATADALVVTVEPAR
jgi:hypothetical protein